LLKLRVMTERNVYNVPVNQAALWLIAIVGSIVAVLVAPWVLIFVVYVTGISATTSPRPLSADDNSRIDTPMRLPLTDER
jgi:uncharacterized membrane protein